MSEPADHHRSLWSVRNWYLYLSAFIVQVAVGLRGAVADVQADGWLATADTVWMGSSSLIITSAGLALIWAEIVDTLQLGVRWLYRKYGRTRITQLRWAAIRILGKDVLESERALLINFGRELGKREGRAEQLLEDQEERERRTGHGSGT